MLTERAKVTIVIISSKIHDLRAHVKGFQAEGHDFETHFHSSGLLPLTGDSDADSLYDMEGKSKIVYY